VRRAFLVCKCNGLNSAAYVAMNFKEPGPLELPLDRDMFIISVQNCRYTVPEAYFHFLDSVAHWFYHIQSYLVPSMSLASVNSEALELMSE